MIGDTVILYGKTKLPADDCKVIFKDRFQGLFKYLITTFGIIRGV